MCVAMANAIELTLDEYKQHWQEWKSFYGKTYESEAVNSARFAVWKNNLKFIQQHNSKGHSYSLTMNELGDQTVDEYRLYVQGLRSELSSETERKMSTLLPPNEPRLPPTVDWRTKGYVTPVKNQGELGKSWAFSVTGSVEGQHFKKTGNLVSLSEQNLVDCSGCYEHGQNHLLQPQAVADCGFEYIIRNGGIDTEAGYPYPCNKSCCFDKDKVGATLTGYVDVSPGSESALQFAVATVGPISVAIDAGHQSFQFYHSGVYNEPSCSSEELDHAVLVVGYGSYEGQDYWLVKNSWGTNWGMQGYIMMSRNKNNQCGIATSASYPVA